MHMNSRLSHKFNKEPGMQYKYFEMGSMDQRMHMSIQRLLSYRSMKDLSMMYI